MTTLFFFVFSCMFVTVWMESHISFDLTCRTQETKETKTNVTWYCDQENGKLTCTNSLTLGCRDNGGFPAFVAFEDKNVVTDQSVLGLQHAGPGSARKQYHEQSCQTKDKKTITNVTWHLKQENGKLSYQPSLKSCRPHGRLFFGRESDHGVQQKGASLTRIKANVSDEAWAGTDCAVKLILRNRDEPLTCQTMTLDGAGDSWERNQVEDFKEEDFREQFLPCKHFYPKPGKLQFQFTCSDSMKLASVDLDFGSTSYSSRGLEDLDWAQWSDTWHNLY